MEAEVRRTLAAIAPSDRPTQGAHECDWKVGTRVTVRLQADRVEVTESEQSFEWNGSWQLLNFHCRIPADVSDGTTILKYDVYVADIRIAKLRLDLRIAKNAKPGRESKAETQSARSAFASYASADRLRVLERVDELAGVGVDVFVDCLSLHANESWKPRLQQEISERNSTCCTGASTPSRLHGSNGSGERLWT